MTSTICSSDVPGAYPLVVVSRIEVKTKQEHCERIKHYKRELGAWYAGAALIIEHKT